MSDDTTSDGTNLDGTNLDGMPLDGTPLDGAAGADAGLPPRHRRRRGRSTLVLTGVAAAVAAAVAIGQLDKPAAKAQNAACERRHIVVRHYAVQRFAGQQFRLVAVSGLGLQRSVELRLRRWFE